MYIDNYQRKKETELISRGRAKEIIEQTEKEITAGLKNADLAGIITSVCGIIKCKIMLCEPEQPES
jgi:hypothetical protein